GDPRRRKLQCPPHELGVAGGAKSMIATRAFARHVTVRARSGGEPRLSMLADGRLHEERVQPPSGIGKLELVTARARLRRCEQRVTRDRMRRSGRMFRTRGRQYAVTVEVTRDASDPER